MSNTTREKYSFDGDFIDENLKTSGNQIDSKWASLNDRIGYLRLRGGASLTSSSNQSIIGRPIDDDHISSVAKVDFRPTNLSHSAGLVSFFNTGFWQYLSIVGADHQLYLQISTCNNFDIVTHYKQQLDIPKKEIELKISLEDEKILFYCSEIKHQWQKIGPTLKINRAYIDRDSLIGICCLDHFGRECHADFEYYKYSVHK